MSATSSNWVVSWLASIAWQFAFVLQVGVGPQAEGCWAVCSLIPPPPLCSPAASQPTNMYPAPVLHPPPPPPTPPQTPGGMWIATVLITTSFVAMGRAMLQLYRCVCARRELVVHGLFGSAPQRLTRLPPAPPPPLPPTRRRLHERFGPAPAPALYLAYFLPTSLHTAWLSVATSVQLVGGLGGLGGAGGGGAAAAACACAVDAGSCGAPGEPCI